MKRVLVFMALAGCYAAGTVGGGDRPPERDPPPERPVVKPEEITGTPYDTVDPYLSATFEDPPPPPPPPPPIDEDVLSHLPKGQEQLDIVCGRGLVNAVTDAFCGATPPEIGGLVDLQRVLGLALDPNEGNGQNGNPSFSISGHSSSLVTRSVSAINPRVILFRIDRDERADQNLVAMGFTRGEQFAELVVSPPPEEGQPQELTFYLVKYTQGCNATDSCNPGDLLTPGTEVDWKGWTLYQDEDLKNSVIDCLQCHQPGGPGTPKLLRMQELQDPWTHWFRDNRPGGIALLADYHAAHGTDGFGGVPGNLIDEADPAELEDFVSDNGFVAQPNEFETDQIEGEVVDSSPVQPELNMPPGESPTWLALYERAVAGDVIPVPYHDVKVTDPAKLAAATESYLAVKSGALSKELLPDIRDVFLDEALPKMSMRPKPGLDGRGILIHMCGQCHNPRLDQTITRARFDVFELDSMSREEKNLAIERLRLPAESRFKMPPLQFRALSDEEIESAVQELLK